jgi:calcium-binding protein CML
MFDIDGNGSISVEELTSKGSMLGELSLMETRNMIADLDENGDGEIDFDEFFHMMRDNNLESMSFNFSRFLVAAADEGAGETEEQQHAATTFEPAGSFDPRAQLASPKASKERKDGRSASNEPPVRTRRPSLGSAEDAIRRAAAFARAAESEGVNSSDGEVEKGATAHAKAKAKAKLRAAAAKEKPRQPGPTLNKGSTARIRRVSIGAEGEGNTAAVKKAAALAAMTAAVNGGDGTASAPMHRMAKNGVKLEDRNGNRDRARSV